MVSGVQGSIRREGFADWNVLDFRFGCLAYNLGVGGRGKGGRIQASKV